MKYEYIKREHIDSLNTLLKDLGPEFVSLRNPRKNNSIEKYFTNPNLKMILAIDSSKVVGYESYIINNNRCKFIGIGVEKKYRRYGVASKLNDLAISDLKKKHVKEIKARTWSTNIKSRSLLEKLGFKKYKTIKNARVNGTDTVWYKLQL